MVVLRGVQDCYEVVKNIVFQKVDEIVNVVGQKKNMVVVGILIWVFIFL